MDNQISSSGTLTIENNSSFRKALEDFIDKDGKVADLLHLLDDCIVFNVSAVHLEEDLKEIVISGDANQRMYLKELLKKYKRTLESLQYNTPKATYELCTTRRGAEATILTEEDNINLIVELLEIIELDGHIVSDWPDNEEEEGVIINPTWPAFERFAFFVEKFNYEKIVIDYINK